MNETEFKFFEELLRNESGLIITPEKEYLLESRLLPVTQKYNIEGGLEGLAQKMRQSPDRELTRIVVEEMTTNETSFFRDNTPFQRLREDLLPVFANIRSAKRKLRILSAACSSGQEPYSLAMLMKEHPAVAGWDIEIVATDLSQDILAQAKKGVYSQFEIQRGLPIQMLVKYFKKEGENWLINDELKKMITFKEVNLLKDIPNLGRFDIILCRNVLIYFDIPTKGKVLEDLKGILEQDGVLFLGGAETVIGISDSFKPLADVRGVYVKPETTFEIKK